MARGKVVQGTRARQMRAEQPVSEGIRRAAARAGIVHRDSKPQIGVDPTQDSARVTVMRGDLAMAAREIQSAFDDLIAAELGDDEAQHDVLVLRALRRLRSAKSMVECEAGGAS